MDNLAYSNNEETINGAVNGRPSADCGPKNDPEISGVFHRQKQSGRKPSKKILENCEAVHQAEEEGVNVTINGMNDSAVVYQPTPKHERVKTEENGLGKAKVDCKPRREGMKNGENDLINSEPDVRQKQSDSGTDRADDRVPPPADSGPPDGGWGWVVVVGCLVCHTLLEGFSRSLGVLFQATLRVFDGTNAQTAVHQSLFNTLRMVLGPVSSVLCMHWGYRPVICVGGVVFGAGVILGGLATDLLQLNLTVGVVAGLGGAMIFTPNYIAIGEYFDKNKGKAMGVATVGSGVGAIIMPPLWTFMFNYYGYFGTMLIVGGLYLNNIVAGGVFRKLIKPGVRKVSKTQEGVANGGDVHNVSKAGVTNGGDVQNLSDERTCKEHNNVNNKVTMTESTHNDQHQRYSTVTPSACEPQPRTSRCRQFSQALTSKFRLLCNLGFLIHALTIATIPFALQATVNFLPSWADELGLTETQSSLLIMLTGVTDIIGRIAFGFIFDHHLVINRRQICYKWVSILFGLITVAICVCTTMTRLITVCLIWGFFEAGSHGQRVTVVSEFVTADQLPDAVGVIIMFQGIGNFISPLVSGFLRDYFETYRLGFIVNGLSMIVIAVIGLIHTHISSCATISGKKKQTLEITRC